MKLLYRYHNLYWCVIQVKRSRYWFQQSTGMKLNSFISCFRLRCFKYFVCFKHQITFQFYLKCILFAKCCLITGVIVMPFNHMMCVHVNIYLFYLQHLLSYFIMNNETVTCVFLQFDKRRVYVSFLNNIFHYFSSFIIFVYFLIKHIHLSHISLQNNSYIWFHI